MFLKISEEGAIAPLVAVPFLLSACFCKADYWFSDKCVPGYK